MLLETISEFWRKVRRTNATASSFAARVATKTNPNPDTPVAASGTSLDPIPTRGGGGLTQNTAQFLFYATGSDNNTFSARVYGWSRVGPVDQDPNKNIYVPVMICEVALTISSTLPGVAGCQVVATELFADTITLTTGNTAKCTITSPTGDVSAACLEVDFTGFPVLEVVFSTGSSATDMNALYRLF